MRVFDRLEVSADLEACKARATQIRQSEVAPGERRIDGASSLPAPGLPAPVADPQSEMQGWKASSGHRCCRSTILLLRCGAICATRRWCNPFSNRVEIQSS